MNCLSRRLLILLYTTHRADVWNDCADWNVVSITRRAKRHRPTSLRFEIESANYNRSQDMPPILTNRMQMLRTQRSKPLLSLNAILDDLLQLLRMTFRYSFFFFHFLFVFWILQKSSKFNFLIEDKKNDESETFENED